ncbi:MAG TPA: PQQ-dependent sugar dehydrogenase [Panacibacter sp.]|nr:PQQ-dependent sugar dehydrogenase [Panacibacter sp.]HNP43621.1 PQQ-dependent sugar dehydrogenase [Panacibacter sp.]
MRTKFCSSYINANVFFTCVFVLILISKQGGAQPQLTYTSILKGLVSPLEIKNAGDGSNRLFIVEQGGKVLIIKNNALQAKPFLDISPIIGNSGYQGIWSIEFAPNYKQTRVFFLLSTGKNGKTELARYQTSNKNPDSADLATRAVLLSFDGLSTGGPHFGQMHFGADGYLYFTLSDGSSPDSTTRFSQDSTNLYGKMCRINVNVKKAPYYSIPTDNPFANSSKVRPEIWAFGFRNAWRWSFDYKTDNLWLPDVEGEQSEELNVITPVKFGAGKNFGWPCYEGNLNFLLDGCRPASVYTFPQFTYLHDVPNGGETVIGGYVYRGAAYPTLRNYFVMSDFTSNNAWLVKLKANGSLETNLQSNIPPFIESYGLDESGEMYAVAMDSNLYRVGASTAAIASQEYNSTNTSADRIFPTVAHTYIMLQLSSAFKYVSITDISGREVLRKDLQGSKGLLQVNLPSLSSGMYVVQLTGEKNVQQKVYIEQ